jgi:hypothetical protein
MLIVWNGSRSTLTICPGSIARRGIRLPRLSLNFVVLLTAYRIWRFGMFGTPVKMDPEPPITSTLNTLPCSIIEELLSLTISMLDAIACGGLLFDMSEENLALTTISARKSLKPIRFPN